AHVSAKKKPLAKRGRKYYFYTAAQLLVLAIIPVYLYLPNYVWVAFGLIAICIWNGWVRHRESGYQLDDRAVTLHKRRLFEQETVMMFHRRIQAMEKKQHRLQQWENIATMELSLIGSDGLGTHYSLRHLQEADVDVIGDWYSREKSVAFIPK